MEKSVVTQKQNDLDISLSQVQSLIAIGLVFTITLVYLYGMMIVVRDYRLIEIAIVVILPIVLLVSGVANRWAGRVKELFFIESIFNVVVIISLIFINMESPLGNRIASWGFVLFFLVQTGGFIRTQIKRKKYHSVFQSAVGFVFIGIWWFGIVDHSAVIDVNGRFLMWGQDAPFIIKLFYTIWATNVLLVDTNKMPNLTQATMHFASIALSWWSGEFFHVRLLTASHLFLLDGVFNYSDPTALSVTFCAIPKPYQDTFEQKIKPAITYISSIIVIIIIMLSFIGGLDMMFPSL